MMIHFRLAMVLVLVGVLLPSEASAQVARAEDAPKPLPPVASGEAFQIHDGFRMELVVAEPWVREPSGVCWDHHGQMFVCELHGYNLEGQYDIEELNKTGELDRVVRRVQAEERHKRAAEAETYGTIRRMIDEDGDGVVDRSEVWADRIPPCLGICPARGGIVAACQDQIWFLADRDDDGTAEVRELLFEGFKKGPLERSINSPQWGPDDWIYFGRGAGGGTIRGKYLAGPVELPGTDFRIRADGTAIEPVTGNTATMGFAFTESGDRFTINTRTPGVFVAPIPWRYLARNPDVAASGLQHNATPEQKVYPTSRPHPWRTRRAEDPGFAKYYGDRYGVEEASPNGFFTSACSPLVYLDAALPNLRGQLLACEPAQNLIHRAVVRRDGASLSLHRADAELRSEFLASSDSWFHAIALSHAPDGSIFVIDFYREIIEDYSAIPRYLQQTYGLVAGRDHGRVWRLTHPDKQRTPSPDMSGLGVEELAREVASPHFWRRTTARRLLVESRGDAAQEVLRSIVADGSAPGFAVTNALQTLDGLGRLRAEDAVIALRHVDPAVRREGLRFAERWFAANSKGADSKGGERAVEESAAIEEIDRICLGLGSEMARDPEAIVRLQLALSLGEAMGTRGELAIETLASLARGYADEPWMGLAILTSLPGRAGGMLAELLDDPASIGKGVGLIEPLCVAIANRRDGGEMSRVCEVIATTGDRALRLRALRGLLAGLPQSVDVGLGEGAKRSLRGLAGVEGLAEVDATDGETRRVAVTLVRRLKLETAQQRRERLDAARGVLVDVTRSPDQRLEAVEELSDEADGETTEAFLESLASSTPKLRDAVVAAILSRQERLPALLDAIGSGRVPLVMLTTLQRETLRTVGDVAMRERSEQLLKGSTTVSAELLAEYTLGLAKPRDVERGAEVFRKACATCHRAHGIGHDVGPDLSAEFQRAEETILRDVIAPSDTISAGYGTYSVALNSGVVQTGLLATETPTSLTLRQAEGKEVTVLRKDVELLRAMGASMMPDGLIRSITPQDFADLLGWLRRPPTKVVLIDENRGFLESLDQGEGAAEFVGGDVNRGELCLRVTPPQRHSPSIKGWEYRIREKPGPGEFRYLRFAWKGTDAKGVMIELADGGRWPSANRPERRYHAGANLTDWQSTEVSGEAPREWTVVTRDLWKDFGDFTLTGIAPTAIGGPVMFDAMELLQEAAP